MFDISFSSVSGFCTLKNLSGNVSTTATDHSTQLNNMQNGVEPVLIKRLTRVRVLGNI
jgi:hypothetical protein